MSGQSFRFVVREDGHRLDRLVADATGCGRRQAKLWIAGGHVSVNGRGAVAAQAPAAGSEVVVEVPDAEPGAGPTPSLAVVFTGARFLVLAKGAGLHCERGQSSPSVAELLEAAWGDLSLVGERPEEAGLVHRLDRDTSGVLLAARDADEYRRLRREFSSGAAVKNYLALVAGRVALPMDVDLPLARRADRMVAARDHDDALAASTRLEALEQGNGWSLVLATMRTGVTHQVRVHAAEAGHPLVGDSLYGGPLLDGCRRKGQLLHALRVRVGGIDATVGPPDDFLAAYAALRVRGL